MEGNNEHLLLSCCTRLALDSLSTLTRSLLRRKIEHITVLFLLLIVLPLSAAKKVVKPVLSEEQERQFKYYWYAAKQAIEQERYTDAYALLEFCHMLNPNDGQTCSFLGVLYEGMGVKEHAQELFKQAYEADPEGQWQRYLDQKMKQCIADGNWDEAIKTQDEIDRHQDYDASSAYMRFRIYAAQGKAKKAIGALDKYLETDPTNIRFLALKMEVLERTNAKTATLYALYEQILALDPMYLPVLNNYAYHLATHKGDLQKAEQMSALTIREDPYNPVYLDTYGWILHLQGQNELAVFYLKKALGNAKDDATKHEIEIHLHSIK